MRVLNVAVVIAGTSLSALPVSVFGQELPAGAAALQWASVNLDPGLASGAAAGPNAENPPVQTTGSTAPDAPLSTQGGVAGYFANWFNRVNQAQASQPHWMTPLVTVTPRLEEEVRYDQFWQHLPNGGSVHNFDGGKGLELIPTTTNEVILGLPAYQERQIGQRPQASGWGDYPFVLVKQRLLSEDERHGNAIVTVFLQVTAPTGSKAFTGDAWVVTPTLAGGKGWGNFDIQATMGVALPVGHFGTTGAQLLTNVAFQYHLLTYFWPEFELNDTIWLGGTQRGGKDQLFLTPGLILGRFDLGGRVRASVGAGYQFAVSPAVRTIGPLDPVYAHNWVLSARVTF